MKSFMPLFSFGLAAISVSAGPVAVRQSTHYSLKISTEGDAALNGQQLEIVESVLGVYPGDRPDAEVYEIDTPGKPGLVSLHTWPIGIVDHVLTLKGNGGLYDLVDTVHISGSVDGTNYDTFKLVDGKVTQELQGGWIAVPSGSGWKVRWYDGTAIIPQDYIPVDIVYNPASY